ncbi:unnamed protein product [Rhodiola kirilowii]
MRWHTQRNVDPEYTRHLADRESLQTFDEEFPKFANEKRNVRLSLATDGFNPFKASCLSHSTLTIVLIPYNVPPHICMKEFNILCMLVSGPKSPGKCLNVFMRPLIEELKMLWADGVYIFDQHDGSLFIMKAAVMWTIGDFPDLGMLIGLKKKGYNACPLCLDEIDATRLTRRMSYQGHRRWLQRYHDWKFATHRFKGRIESRDPQSFFDPYIFHQIMGQYYHTLSLHPQFKPRGRIERLCCTHMSTFYELPYFQKLSQPYSLDVMHIETNFLTI